MRSHKDYSLYEFQLQYQKFGNDWVNDYGNEWGLFVDLENSYSNTINDNDINTDTNNIIINNNNTFINNKKKYNYQGKYQGKNKYYLYFISISTLFVCTILNFTILFLMIFIFSFFVYSILFYLFYLFALLQPCVSSCF